MSLEIDSDLEFPDMGDESEQALRDILEYMLHESNKIVPFEEGTLKRSGMVDVEGKRGTVSYDTPYAIYQHEATDWAHSHGQEAKFLEKTIKNKHSKALDYLKEEFGGLF